MNVGVWDELEEGRPRGAAGDAEAPEGTPANPAKQGNRSLDSRGSRVGQEPGRCRGRVFVLTSALPLLIFRYSDDNQNCKEFCIIEYPESPDATAQVKPAAAGSGEAGGNKDESRPAGARPRPLAGAKPSKQDGKGSEGPGSTKKKKPFHCKPCHFQAENEQQFVEHLRTHSASKMMVVNHVEGRSRNKTRDTDAAASGDVEGSGDAAAADSKGLIRCERCGYNTNRFDHYIAHLKHHSKEGDDHR